MKAKQAKEFFEALNYISAEKGLNSSSLIKKLEKAIVLAVKKQYGKVEDINVDIDEKNLNFNVSFKKMVVDVVKNSSNEILLEDALKYNKKAKIGEPIEIKVDATQIGRLAAQAAKQQIMQGIKDIERENVLEKIGDKIGRILTAKVDVIDPVFGNVIFKIDDSDVVLYKNGNRYLLHRILKIKPDEYLIRGDNTRIIEHVPQNALLATMTGFYRYPDGRLISRDDHRYRLYQLMLPCIRSFRRIKNLIKRIHRKLRGCALKNKMFINML